MDGHEHHRLLEQIESVIEQTHKLQTELLELLRAVTQIETGRDVLPHPPRDADDAPASESLNADVLAALPDKLMLSVKEVGAILGIGRASAYRAASTGDIPSVRLGRRLLIPRAALVRMLHG